MILQGDEEHIEFNLDLSNFESALIETFSEKEANLSKNTT